jgi:hypothetical protein
VRFGRGGFDAIDKHAFNAVGEVCQVFEVKFFDFLFFTA